jgi:hypothetical protein
MGTFGKSMNFKRSDIILNGRPAIQSVEKVAGLAKIHYN